MRAFRTVYAGSVLLHDTVRTAIRGVTANKTQAALTMLGIIIGVGSVTLMQSIGASFQGYIINQINSVGSHTMGVVPKGINQMGADMTSLTFEDFNAIARLPTVTSATPGILVPQKVTVGKESSSPYLIGARKEIFANYGMKLQEGRFLDNNDELGAKSVVVIAHQTSKDLFGDDDPVGKRVTIGNGAYTVVGLLQEVGSPVLQELESAVIMPFSSARVLTGQTALTLISLQTTSDAILTKADITAVLRQRHQIHNPENDPKKDNFEVRSTQQAEDIISTVSVGLTVFLSLIAAISLVVGGIGIMNIMLVSVLERTREIGLRKAVGARSRDILLQFLLEALTLTLTGGIIGLLLGAGLGWLICALASKALGSVQFIISFQSIVLAMGMAVGTGLVFGIVPAKNAAELNPIEALRYE